MGITHEVLAFQVDNAVHSFGTALAHDLQSVEGKNHKEIEKKQKAILSRWLGMPQQFRDPAAETVT